MWALNHYGTSGYGSCQCLTFSLSLSIYTIYLYSTLTLSLSSKVPIMWFRHNRPLHTVLQHHHFRELQYIYCFEFTSNPSFVVLAVANLSRSYIHARLWLSYSQGRPPGFMNNELCCIQIPVVIIYGLQIYCVQSGTGGNLLMCIASQCII